MVINVSVQCNGGFLPDITLLNSMKCHGEVSSLQPMFPPKCFDIFPIFLGDAQNEPASIRCLHAEGSGGTRASFVSRGVTVV